MVVYPTTGEKVGDEVTDVAVKDSVLFGGSDGQYIMYAGNVGQVGMAKLVGKNETDTAVKEVNSLFGVDSSSLI